MKQIMFITTQDLSTNEHLTETILVTSDSGNELAFCGFVTRIWVRVRYQSGPLARCYGQPKFTDRLAFVSSICVSQVSHFDCPYTKKRLAVMQWF